MVAVTHLARHPTFGNLGVQLCAELPRLPEQHLLPGFELALKTAHHPRDQLLHL